MEPAVFPFHLRCFGVAVTFLASNNKNKIPILVSQKPLEKQMQKKQNKFISFFLPTFVLVFGYMAKEEKIK